MNGLAKRLFLYLFREAIQEVIDSPENQDGIAETIENELAENGFRNKADGS